MDFRKSVNKNRFYLLSFAIPFGLMLMVMLVGGYEPFGNDRSMLYSDMYHQYYPFFTEFRRALLSGESLQYNWSVGLGMDYLALIPYYLSSPLNLLVLLVPESLTLEVFSLLMPIKLGLASLFFAIFLNRVFDKNDLSISLFGAMYGLCAWALGYQWNVMWLDTFALLPLLTLGTIYLLRDKKFGLYTITLFLSVFANYYIGLFSCIFVLLTFVCYEICRWPGFKRFALDFCRIGVFTVLALGMTAIIELPALAGLQNTQSSVNSFPTGFRLNIASENTVKGLLEAMGQVASNMAGGIEPTFKEGLPNLYCGVGTIVLAVLFLTTRGTKLRDKIVCVILLLFFNVSFIIRQLDYIWHGFHFTNMIPYRFSFLYSFVMLYMAYRAYLKRDQFKLWQLILAGVLSVAMLALSEQRTDVVFLLYNGGFLAAYLGCFFYGMAKKAPAEDADPEEFQNYRVITRRRQQICTMAVTTVMAVELIANIVNFGVRFPYTTVTNYPKGTEDTQSVLEYMEEQESDTLFYRAETTHSQTLNDGALNGYHGISTFTSSANVNVTVFMKALGYGAKNTYNRYCFEESSPIANLFLNLKYMIERDGNVEDNSYFDTVYTSGDVALQQNLYYLSLGFLANPELADVDWTKDVFTLQNDLLKAAAGVEENAWTLNSPYSISAENVTLDKNDGGCYCKYSDAQSGGAITYKFTADRDGFMCLLLDVTDRNSYTVNLNGELLYSESLSLPQMIAVSDVKAGDVVTVRLTCKEGEDGNMTIKAGILDQQIFQQAYDVLSSSQMELTNFSNTLVEGTVDCDRDGLLYTSIPQNGNWTVYVDGEEVEATLIGDAMIGVYLNEGQHQLRFEYKNTAFALGWKISLACAVIFGMMLLVSRFKKKRVGKYQAN